MLSVLREAAINSKRKEEFDALLQINKEHRNNLNQNKFNIELIEQGADINMLNDEGESALHIASLTVDLDLFKQLMALNPNLNLQNIGGSTVLSSTLEKVIYNDKNEAGRNIVTSLLKAEVDLDIKDKNEVTPLILAVKNDDFLLVKTLGEHGAKIETL